MKKSFKILWMLMLCSLTAVALACLSACSVILDTLEDDGDSDSVAGSYKIDLSKYDDEWYNNVVDDTMWSTTAAVGAYAYDTLVLNEDGSYALTKEMGADDVATEHWSTDGGATDVHFSTYTYYGTYTVGSDGYTVTLSEVTKIAYEVNTFDISISQGVGYNVEYTETTDLESTAGTLSGDTVIDLWYGFYLVNSGHGNCEQEVTLGDYDYGDFSFIVEEVEEEEDTRAYYAFVTYEDSKVVEGITLKVYEDGTYTFTNTDYDIAESGTYTWDRVTQTLTLVAPDTDKTETVATVSGDDITFTYYYSEATYIYYDFSGSVDDMEAVLCEVVFEFIPLADSNVSLTIYSDKTYTYNDKTNGVRESGTYDLDRETQVLTLTLPNESTIKSQDMSNYGNVMYILYEAVSGESNQGFIGSLADAVANIPSAEVIYSFIPGSGNSAIYLDMYDDYTYEFGYTTYGVTETGTFTYIGGNLAFVSKDGSTFTVTITDGDIYVYFDYMGGGQLTQTFVGTVLDLNAGLGIAYNFTPGSGNAAIYLTLYTDYTYEFGYTTYNVTESGTWTYVGGNLAFTSSVGSTLAVTTADGAITVEFDYMGLGQLTQTFIGEVLDLNAGLGIAYNFTPGSGNTAIYLTLYTDGSYVFGFTTYGLTESGTWMYGGGYITFKTASDSTTVITVTYDGDTISAYYNYAGAGQLDQTFIGSVSEMNEALGIIYSFTPGSGNTAVYLDLYEDGTYEFGFTTYGVSEIGTWTYANGTVAFASTVKSTFEVTVSGDVITIDFDYMAGGQLTQTFTGSIADIIEAAGIIYSFTPGSGNAAMYLNLYADGTYEFGFTSYGVSESGTWTYVNGTLIFTPVVTSSSTITVTVADGTITAYYDYLTGSGLDQYFTGSISDIYAASDIVYSFTPASGNSAIYLNLHEDGTYEFGFTTYGVTETGTWTYSGGTLAFTSSIGSTLTVSVADGVISVYYDYMSASQLTQTFTGSASDIDKALGDN